MSIITQSQYLDISGQTVEGTVSIGDPIYYNTTNNQWEKATTTTAMPYGVYSGNNRIITRGYIEGLTGLTAGIWYYLDSTGGLTDVNSGIMIGYAESSSKLFVSIDNCDIVIPVVYNVGSPLLYSGVAYHNMCMTITDNTVWSWGNNTNGQLGDNSIDNKSSPVSVLGGHSFNMLTGGLYHTVGIKSDGLAWSWGSNTNGELGDNSIIKKSSPISVLGDHSFNQISAGANFTLGLKYSDGSVWSWGINTNGELGDNTVIHKSSPVSVVGDHSFIQIAAGSSHSTALRFDGTAWCWGINTYGQLGINSITTRSVPSSVVGGHVFNFVSSGIYHTMALKSDGSCWGWGYNDYGQLGDHSTSNSSSPVSTVGDHSFIQVACGTRYTVALKSDGSAWCWGQNNYGFLGDDSRINQSSPSSVAGGHSFVLVTGGLYSFAAYKSDGSVWSWGRNTYGQIGDNTVIHRSSPVSVVRLFN